MFLILTIVLVALVFEFINGFHVTANATAMSLATKVMTPRQAVAIPAVFNLVGALVGTLGIPLSTTHVVSAAIMGAGATNPFSAVKWDVVERMAWAWILTLPITAFLGWGLLRVMQVAGRTGPQP